jgi:hypothetical protein
MCLLLKRPFEQGIVYHRDTESTEEKRRLREGGRTRAGDIVDLAQTAL